MGAKGVKMKVHNCGEKCEDEEFRVKDEENVFE